MKKLRIFTSVLSAALCFNLIAAPAAVSAADSEIAEFAEDNAGLFWSYEEWADSIVPDGICLNNDNESLYSSPLIIGTDGTIHMYFNISRCLEFTLAEGAVLPLEEINAALANYAPEFKLEKTNGFWNIKNCWNRKDQMNCVNIISTFSEIQSVDHVIRYCEDTVNYLGFGGLTAPVEQAEAIVEAYPELDLRVSTGDFLNLFAENSKIGNRNSPEVYELFKSLLSNYPEAKPCFVSTELAMDMENIETADIRLFDRKVATVADSNCDSAVNMADAVMIMQNVANPDKYGLGAVSGITPQGCYNGDIDGEPGLTNKDALMIQQYRMGIAEIPDI